ncbi:hypothetical protein N7462_001958 [Penicillium macrosclerotiorum]|uniref:uncharacterized protein n=1 Tax=Penicillium macrosclerotiorum TaxID=303699 RepID=UPI0025477A93|nr:uncharacterized protein N7462_001958 [Penicillium macrosclerotiorum]KAJ5692535.1 hypothetical protein N7462_001958 [Penicillium macrosclerotiorum]
MYLKLLVILLFAPFVLADDWEDFTNNLATDLAPLITLFGERLTKQFLSESISLLDNVIFALSPLGVLTAAVSVIRVCGSSSLRAFVGRAQEGPAEAENEILPCVSGSTAELFNEGGISRVFGRPKILEIVAWEEGSKAGEKTLMIGTLRDALRENAWSIKNPEISPKDIDEFLELPELEIPNLSLNKGIKRQHQLWFRCVAIIGTVLQTGVVVYAAITVFIFPGSFKKDGKAVPSYAFPLYITGTSFLFLGMLYCAIIIQRSSKNYKFMPEKPSKLYWLQPGNQNVGDQVFRAFLASEEEQYSKLATSAAPYIKSMRFHRNPDRYMQVYLALFFTVTGYIFQFIGLRGLHASVILAQLGSTFVMAVLRTFLRTERMTPEENKLLAERDLVCHKQQELDYFAFHFEGVDSLRLVSPPTPPDTSADDSSATTTQQPEDPLVSKVIQRRARLAEMTHSSDDNLHLGWDNIAAREQAQRLAKTIEATMDSMSSWGQDFGKLFQFNLTFECKLSPPKSTTSTQGTFPINLRRCGDALRWQVNANELEAIIGLWTWSLYKPEENWQKPLYRMIGLDHAEAGKEETYLCFRKWIFRQTKAKLFATSMIDARHQLFGFESDEYSNDKDILAVRTENNLETMVAQDIYIHFLDQAMSDLEELGGDVDVVSGLQNSWLAQNNRVNEMVQHFEDCDFGSREDALLCIIPVLKKHNILPPLAADSRNVKKRTENFIEKRDWESAFSLIRWLCQRTEGPEFEYSVYQLGYLCQLAMLDGNKSAMEYGLDQACSLFKNDIRDDSYTQWGFCKPSHWQMPQQHVEWWLSFARQLSWTAWTISTSVENANWMQPILKTYNVPQTILDPKDMSCTNEDAQKGLDAFQMLMTANNSMIDTSHLNYRSGEAMFFQWAHKTSNYALIYFFLMRMMKLSEEHPALIEMAWTLASSIHSDWVIEILRRQNADIEAVDDYGASALVTQVRLNDLKAVEMLVDKGADPNANDIPNFVKPLLEAASEGFTDIVETLLHAGANINIRSSIGHTAVHLASIYSHFDTVRLLAGRGANMDLCGVDGNNPISSAVTNEKIEMVDLLVDHGCNTNYLDDAGRTPLMLAVLCMRDSSKGVKMLRFLLSRHADPNIRDPQGFTALDLAKDRGWQEGVSVLNTVTGQ